MLLSALIPVLVWKLSPAKWHPYFQVLAALALILTAVVLWRYITRERSKIANRPSRSEYRWPEGWTVLRYSRSLLTYLKIQSWRVMAVEALGADRIVVCLQRDKQHLTLMCLRPGQPADADDVAYLQDARRQQGTMEAVLISDPPMPREPGVAGDGARLLAFDYEALPDLFDLLERGAEAARREAAAKDALVDAA